MSQVYLYMNRVNGWAQVVAGVLANEAQVPQLLGGLPRLELLIGLLRSLSVQFAAVRANKQEMAQQIQAVLREGDALADFLKTGARAHYGSDSEKLVEFGVQPFRGRSKKKVTEPPPLPETVAPSDSATDTVE
ncbi:MAG: hypothetical protein QOH06_5129 [Acidobacteriota bacterium]|jgi:hypothetical protein|nr:hypothetical protein [Acidobacteriota bacterium]